VQLVSVKLISSRRHALSKYIVTWPSSNQKVKVFLVPKTFQDSPEFTINFTTNILVPAISDNTFVSAIIHNTFATMPLSTIPYTGYHTRKTDRAHWELPPSEILNFARSLRRPGDKEISGAQQKLWVGHRYSARDAHQSAVRLVRLQRSAGGLAC
jgi:hypothetical protein